MNTYSCNVTAVYICDIVYTVCVFQFHRTCLSCSCMNNTNRFYEIEIATHMSIFLCTCTYYTHFNSICMQWYINCVFGVTMIEQW